MRFPVPATLRHDIRIGWGASAIDRLRAIASTGYPRVAGAPDTSYYLAGVAPFSVVAVPHSHSPWSLEGISGQARRDDMDRLLDPSATVDERRAILERWDASFVIVALDNPSERVALPGMLEQRGLFRPVLSTPKLVLLRVLR